MSNSAITSYAILKVNWEQPEQRDYIDNFVLIVAEAIRQLPHDTVVINDVQDQIKNHFHLDLPQNTIKSLLDRVKKRGYIQVKRGTFTRNHSALATLNFREIQQKVIEAHEALIKDLIAFASAPYNIIWSNDEAEEALQAYLQENQVELLTDLLARTSIKTCQITHISHKNKYVIGKYIQHLQVTQSAKLEYLETVIKGNLLANSVCMTDPGTHQRRFKHTTVFLDSPLIIYALGYAGDPRKWPALELIDLLKKYGANLAIFRHSLDEIIGILTACAARIGRMQFRDSYGPSIEYFIEKGYSETDIMMFVHNLETNLSAIGIAISDRPPYSEHENIIDETIFLKYLGSQIRYSKKIALERDKESITAIVRLRRGNSFIPIEECRAIFVTSNRSLAYCARRYDEFNYQAGTAPLSVTDYELTNLVWLKDPSIAPNLPRKRLIADFMAAIQPNEQLWTKYLDCIAQLEQQNKLSDDQYFVLRHSIQARSELMEITLGDETVFSEGTVSEVLAVIEESFRAEGIARANAAELAKQDALMRFEKEREERLELEEKVDREKEARISKNRLRARRIARYVLLSVSILLVIAVGYLTYAISPIGPLNIDPNTNNAVEMKLIGLLFFWVLLFLQTLIMMFGFMPKITLYRFESRLTAYIEKWLSLD